MFWLGHQHQQRGARGGGGGMMDTTGELEGHDALGIVHHMIGGWEGGKEEMLDPNLPLLQLYLQSFPT